MIAVDDMFELFQRAKTTSPSRLAASLHVSVGAGCFRALKSRRHYLGDGKRVDSFHLKYKLPSSAWRPGMTEAIPLHTHAYGIPT